VTSRVPPIVAVDIGPQFTSVWSPGGSLDAQPSVVAVDRSGEARAHGFRAVLGCARRSSGLRLVWPFERGRVGDPDLARQHLNWALEQVGRRRFRGKVILPVHTGLPESARRGWQALVESTRAHPVLLERPMTAALGLGLDVDGPQAHLVVELAGSLVEVSVVAEGSVVAARLLDPPPNGLFSVASAIQEMLRTLDPDHELDIRDDGIHLHGWSIETDATALAELVDVAIAPGSTMPSAVAIGARRALEETLPYLVQA
jgi:actin-like ATPase involved in cell morphogenesis